MRYLLILASALLILQACSKDQASIEECSDAVFYSTDIAPILNNSCNTAGCHDASSAGGYDFTTHATVSTNAQLMLSAIRHETGPTPMPLGGTQLPEETIKTFKCWIDQGKLDN